MKTNLTPRQQAKRFQIREGAKRMFLEKGFSGASTDAIAAEAGVSKQTLYTYYHSKEELMADVLRQLMVDVLHQWPVEANESLIRNREQLRRELTAQAQRMITSIMQPEYMSLVRVIVSEAHRLPQLGNLFRETVGERALESIMLILDRARGETVVKDLDVEAASRMFVGFLLTHAILGGLLVPEGKLERPEFTKIESMVDLYLKAIT